MIGLVLAAAGTGDRFGAQRPKQFALIDGEPLYIHAMKAFLPFCSQTVIVLPEKWIPRAEAEIGVWAQRNRIALQAGGEERQDSVRRGLERLDQDIEIVLVHDAARPFCSGEVIERVIQATRLYQACLPTLKVADTVKEVSDGVVRATLDRRRLRLAQTPQGFRRDLLQRAFEEAERDGFRGTDEAMLVERLGLDVHEVEGDRANRKVTWRDDL